MRTRPAAAALAAIVLLIALPGIADDAVNSTRGVVAAKSADFLFVRPPGDVGRRYWLKPPTTGPTTAVTARPEVAVFDRVQVGDEVTLTWTGDDRRRQIETLRYLGKATPATQAAVPAVVENPLTRASRIAPPATTTLVVADAAMRPAAEAAAKPVAAPATTAIAVSDDAANRSTLGERVNAAIDDAMAVSDRLIQLPMSVLLAVVVIVGVMLLVAARKLDGIARPAFANRLRWATFVVGGLFVALVIDRKIATVQSELNALRVKINADALNAGDRRGSEVVGTNGTNVTVPASQPSRSFFFDPAAAQAALAATFKTVTIRPTVYDAATDVVQIRSADPLVQATLAIVDLTNPAVRIKLGTTLDKKRLTSVFAKENDCSVAINGEAGQSPALNSGLGPWRGFMVDGGKIVLQEDAKIPRPFIGFDAKNVAAFTPAAKPDRTLPAKLPTVIWGRLDSVVDGVVQTADERFRQPRTAMGVSGDGRRLFLLVIDGRQPRYSVGVTRAEVGFILKAFGAHNGMLCDEGGSSCLYLKKLGGIANIPSDNNGTERPTYTHFGIAMRETP